MTTPKKPRKYKNKQLELVSVTLEPSEEEIFNMHHHFDQIVDIFVQGPIKKINLHFPLATIDQLTVYLQNFQDSYVFNQQLLNIVTFFWRSDIIVINQELVVAKLLEGIVGSILAKEQISLDELRARHFKIFRYLPDQIKDIFKKGLLEEAVKQSCICTHRKGRKQCQSISNLFALMLLDDYVEVEVLMLRSLNEYHAGNKKLGLCMVEVLMNSPYSWIFEHQCRKFIVDDFKKTIIQDLQAQQDNQAVGTWDEVLIQINNANNTQQLQQILQDNYSNLDEEKLGFASFRMSCFKEKPQNVPTIMLQRFVEIQHNFSNTRWLQQFIRGLGLKKCKLTDEQSRAITEQINKNYKKFNAGQCQSILHKFVPLNIDSTSTIKNLLQQLCAKFDETDLEALSKSLWTIGALQIQIKEDQLKLITEQIWFKIDQAGVRECTQILRGLTEQSWRKHSKKFVTQIVKTTKICLRENNDITNKRVVNIFSSLARMNCLDKQCLYIINNTLRYNKQFDLSPDDVAQVLQGVDAFINKGRNDEQTTKMFNGIIIRVLTIRRLQSTLMYCKRVKINELIICLDGLIYLRKLKKLTQDDKSVDFIISFIKTGIKTNRLIGADQFQSVVAKAEVLGISHKRILEINQLYYTVCCGT
eukprot:TRINITY_DN6373_c1_g2_i1.p1 TRINITY_DN6373_c1_g2~~TRINITY_DN6373_c1_g2_i1.p1  ORF type:complete len:643 (+),score=44.27 TRINITY_DN6373_c1_g2_i1:91-2019(+)